MLSLCIIKCVPRAQCKFWRITALEINGNCPVVSSLIAWRKNSEADFKAIKKVMIMVASQHRVATKKHVVKSRTCDEIYEMRAGKLNARIMFFYSPKENLVVCTNPYEKNQPNQHAAFDLCENLRERYFRGKSHESGTD